MGFYVLFWENCNAKKDFLLTVLLNRSQLVRTDSHSDSIVSYGVRNSIATYLSFSANQDLAQTRADSRKKKSKSIYVIPENALANIDYDDL